MKGWKISGRAIGAWLGAAFIAALAFGLTLALCNAWADVTGRNPAEFASTGALLASLAGVGLTLAGGLLLLIVSVLAPLLKAPRPLTEIVVLAGACALATTIGGVSFDLNTPNGVVRPSEHPAAFIVAYVAPAAAGALMGFFYRRFAGPAG